MNPSEFKTKVDALLKFQENEIETASLRSSLELLPDRLGILSERIEDFNTRIAGYEARMSELQKNYRQQEVEAQSIQAQIEKSNEKLKTVKTNKEYQAGLHEIDDLIQMQSGVEDQMLECLEAIDEAESAVASERESLGAFSRQVEDEKAQVERESAEMQQKLKQLQRRREQVLTAIDPELLKKYEHVKAYSGAIVLAAVKEAICQGCHMNIPPQMYNDLHKFDRLLYCPHCERIIYPYNKLDGD